MTVGAEGRISREDAKEISKDKCRRRSRKEEAVRRTRAEGEELLAAERAAVEAQSAMGSMVVRNGIALRSG